MPVFGRLRLLECCITLAGMQVSLAGCRRHLNSASLPHLFRLEEESGLSAWMALAGMRQIPERALGSAKPYPGAEDRVLVRKVFVDFVSGPNRDV